MQKPLLVAVSMLSLLYAAPPAAAQVDSRMVGTVTALPDNRTGKDFVQSTMTSSKFAIEASKFALNRSRDPAIQGIARDTIAFHVKFQKDLKSVTDRIFINRRVTPPPVLNTSQKKMYNLLEIKHGPAFDSLYTSQQLDTHLELLETVEGYANHSKVPKLQAFARRELPAVRDQLARLRGIGTNVAVNVPDDRY